ncbi:hypothetical protein K5X77_07275 [Vagococcus lutrae]|uniref:hypothetical protein n=1 Tax=Vagococcus TaxID=2737 RepID=UPI001C97EF60|nr:MULTISPECIES: hypothetical protein [Vagococcus]MCI0131071.1 hypothetical protein [Vagococcus sp. CY53-2]QZN88265.1 hypothetical protein K5X77_07275 [Vagococcus lutrae]UNM89705.1 hypothetical protein MN187_01010 [Vagococcus sp. CY52-2]UQF70188.1 hypothetical protein M2901_05140 [Vagococcus lutrae]
MKVESETVRNKVFMNGKKTRRYLLQGRLKEILNLLTKTNKEKVVAIVDEKDRPIHPLVPSIRNQPWTLEKIKI